MPEFLVNIYQISKKILESTPENWLEFSAGQNTKTNLLRFKSNICLSFGKQIFGFLFFLINSYGIKSLKTQKNDVLFFASTLNQYSVLNSIYKEHAKFKAAFAIPNTSSKTFNTKDTNPYYLRISFIYILPVLLLLLRRLFPLLKILWQTDRRLIFLRLNSFLQIYYWLIAHQVFLKKIQPKVVIMSNDHNPENRTLIEICKYFDIKTAYVPHASVSDRFHSLDFNYSFLDGQHALDIYKKCDSRRAPNSMIIDKRLCYLVGNLRKLEVQKKNLNQSKKFGLAVKGTDNINNIIYIISKLSAIYPVSIRPHPSLKFNKSFHILDKRFPGLVELSDPHSDSVSSFLSSIDIFVSGNTTLSLEAASAEIYPVYLNELSNNVNDYYGFVKRKIVHYFDTIDDFVISHNKGNLFLPDKNGINHYWSSYNQTTFGNEAKIISNYLRKIVDSSYELPSNYSIYKETL